MEKGDALPSIIEISQKAVLELTYALHVNALTVTTGEF